MNQLCIHALLQRQSEFIFFYHVQGWLFLQLYMILLSILETHTLNCFSKTYRFTESMVSGQKGPTSYYLLSWTLSLIHAFENSQHSPPSASCY